MITAHASQMLKMRQISKAGLIKALSTGLSRTDSKTGHEVIRDGNIRIVVKRDNDHLVILTVTHADDFAE